jgi:CRISPR system Cascade subunit CasA
MPSSLYLHKDSFMTENRFNLISEPWLPIADVGKVSLRQVFTHLNYRALGGNPVQKIALNKLLLAIAQAASTPNKNFDWRKLSLESLAQNCLNYLEQWHDSFYLYGDKPFLQMPAIAQAATQNTGAVLPEIATGNTTILNSIQIEKELSDADKALLIVQLMGFGLGGKKTDNSIVLSKGYTGKSNDKGKASTGRAGTSLGFMGFLHNFLQGQTLLETLWLNLLSAESIRTLPYPQLGIPPWEKMPEGEDCEIANALKNSLMGRLIPLSRFCLLNETGLHYSEGIAHSDYKLGKVDPSVAANLTLKDKKALWVDTEKRPWRSLTALLSFMETKTASEKEEKTAKSKTKEKIPFECYYLKNGIGRATSPFIHLEKIGIWSGGLRVSSNAGEQYVSGTDDFVESIVFIKREDLGQNWYVALKEEMAWLENLGSMVYASTFNYFEDQKVKGKDLAGAASNLFWQLCERKFQELVLACEDKSRLQLLRNNFIDFVETAYNNYCPHQTDRQIEIWAKNFPRLTKYKIQETKA